MIERYEIDDWENHPITKHFRELITKTLEFNSQQLATGELLNLPDIGNKYNYSIGFMDGLRFVLNAELEEREDEATQ